MSFLIRNALFQMYRFSPVTSFGRHYNDLTSFYKLKYPRARTIDHRLKRILHHAIGSTDYYGQFKNYSSLQDFPVIQKSLIKENLPSFLSGKYFLKSLKKSATSGSYGSPFVYYMTNSKRNRQLAEIVYFSSLAGFLVGMKHIHIASRHPSPLYETVLNQILKNPSLIDDQWLEELKNVLSKGNVQFIVGYTSALSLFAEYCLANNIPAEKFNLKGLIAIAEPLPKQLKSHFENVFRCPATSRYASMETGVIAQQSPGNDEFTVNTSSYFIELLRSDCDLPVRKGEQGRVVITDFFSHAFPLIRYDIGDIAISDTCAGSGIQSFSCIQGRHVEMLTRSDGTWISPLAIDDIMDRSTGIAQFQFIQEASDTYRLKFVSQDGCMPNESIFSQIKNILGNRAELHVERVENIEALPSGKRPYVINKMNPSKTAYENHKPNSQI